MRRQPVSKDSYGGSRGQVGFREETYMYIGRGLEVVKLILQLLERARWRDWLTSGKAYV